MWEALRVEKRANPFDLTNPDLAKNERTVWEYFRPTSIGWVAEVTTSRQLKVSCKGKSLL